MKRSLLAGLLTGLGSFALAEPVLLDTLLIEMDKDPVVLAAQADYETSRAEQSLRKIEAGPRLFLNASAGHYRELNSANLIDDYFSRHMAIGVRIPLLGSLHRQLDALTVAEFETQRKDFQLALRRAERRLALRVAYADWWRAQQELQLCASWRPRAASALKQVDARRRAGWLRTSTALSEESEWGRVKARCDAAAAAEPQLKAHVELLVGRPLQAESRAVAVPLGTDPASLDRWQARIDQHPGVMEGQTQVEENRRLKERSWHRSVDASLSVGYGMEDRSGVSRYGNDFVAALNFSIPFNVGGHVRASDKAAASRYQAARHRVEAARRQLMTELSSLLLGLRQFSHTLVQLDANLVAVKVKLAEQQARMALEDEDGVLLRAAAERELAFGQFERIAVWHGLWSRSAALQMFTDGSSADPSLLGTHWVTWRADGAVVPAAAPAATAMSLQTESTNSREQSPGDRVSPSWSEGTYVWRSGPLLNEKQRTRELAALRAAGVSRIYVGLDADQVSRLESTRKSLHGLLSQAGAEGMSVSLLLGEPLWMEPAHRAVLTDLIHALRALPFASLHLDLEVEQLGWPVPETRLREWLDTVQAAKGVSPWPIELSSHHRWFTQAQEKKVLCVPCELTNMGIEGVSLMIYTRNVERSAALTAEAAGRWPGLHFRLAQSLEKELSRDESWAGAPAAALKNARQTWQQQLRPLGVTGIDWQSWTDYRRETVGTR